MINENAESDEDMIELLEINPTAVAIETQPDMMFYRSGVYSPKNKDCGEQLNHGVLLVAMNEKTMTIKNSWGPQWGEKGFIRMAKY